MLELIASLIAIVIIVLTLQLFRLDRIIKDMNKKFIKLRSQPWPERKTPNQIRAEYGLGPIVNRANEEKQFINDFRAEFKLPPMDSKIFEERFNAIIGRSAPAIMIHSDFPPNVNCGASAALLEQNDEIKHWRELYEKSESDLHSARTALRLSKTVLEKANKEVKALKMALLDIANQPNCNNCPAMDCSYKPGVGGQVRFNCPLHPEAQGRPFVHIRVSPVFKKEN